MNYILIFIWQAFAGNHPTSALSAEFKSMASCQAAAKEIKAQAKADAARVPLLMCAEKGVN